MKLNTSIWPSCAKHSPECFSGHSSGCFWQGMSMDQTYEGATHHQFAGWASYGGFPGVVRSFQDLVIWLEWLPCSCCFERNTGVCLGLPSWMYIDCNRHPPQIWIPLVIFTIIVVNTTRIWRWWGFCRMMKNILIAYHMLESSSGAYLEWLSNELNVTAKTLNIRMRCS